MTLASLSLASLVMLSVALVLTAARLLRGPSLPDRVVALDLLTTLGVGMLAVGVWRLPDVYTRLSATSKAATLGAACVLLAGALHFHEAGVSSRALAAIAFVMLTAPVAAHMIGRAAYLTGVPLWEGTRFDEMRDHLERGETVAKGSADRRRPDPGR